jgi:hypothetical protein
MYGLNTLTKLYMQKYGFETYLDTDIFSTDFARDNCNRIVVEIVSESTIFSTKVKVILKDCKNTILFTSPQGKSNEKEYKVAYNLALREAFDSFDVLKMHKYQASVKTDVTNNQLEHRNEVPVMGNKNDITEYRASEWTYVVNKQSNGYLIKDKSNSSFFLELLKTSDPTIFIGKSNKGNGIVRVKGDYLVYEYYEKEVLTSQIIMVKI